MLKKSNKPSKQKAKKQKLTKEHLVLIILSAVVGILIVATIIGGYFLLYIYRAQQSDSGMAVRTLILQAVDNLSVPAPIDAQTGNVYIPQKKLVFPAMEDTFGAEIRYHYSLPAENFPEELGIVNTYGLQTARTQIISLPTLEAFESVPDLQACSRGYTISFTELSDRGNPTFTKTLKDGRTIWVYLDEGCTQTLEDFEAYLKQVDSY